MKYKLLLDNDNYVTAFMHTNSREDIYELNPLTMDLEHLNSYKLVDGSLILDEEKREHAVIEEQKKEEEAKLEADKVKMLTEMLLIIREPSDKLGFDFEIYMLGNVELRREYVPSESHAGTIDDPIPFELGLKLIPNAFYLYDAHLWVYMGQGGVTADDYPVEDVNGWVLWE